MVHQALLLIFPLAMAFAAANDLFTMRIPNKISLVLIGAFPVVAFIAAQPLTAIGMHVAVGAAVLVVTFAMFSFRLLGGGDAKLLAAGALWMGPDYVLPFVTYVALFGGVLSIIILLYRRLIPAGALPLPAWASRLHAQGTGIPYGIAIAAAGMMTYPQTAIFKAMIG